MIRALLLDLDNTLVDRDAALCGWLHALIPDAAERALRLPTLCASDGGGHRPRGHFFAQLAQHTGLPLPTLRRRFLSEFPLLFRLKPDADALLRAYPGRTVIVTNGPAELQRRKIEAAGLERRVEHILISGECGLQKPDPRIFQLALTLSECAGAQALMVGDHPRHDLAAARRAGIDGVLVRTPWFSVPHGVRAVDQLTELVW